jgi:leucyl-tRNA synthetase
MYIGPVELDAAWDPRSVGGVYRFLNRCWTLVFEKKERIKDEANVVIRNKTTKKVTTDIVKNNFNTAVSALMEYVNELFKTGASNEDLVILGKLIKPFAPHLASEILEELGTDDEWPKWDEKHLATDEVEVVVQVNGKLRAKLTVDKALLDDEAEIIKLATEDEKVKKFTENGIIKTIFVKNAKLVNIVAK